MRRPETLKYLFDIAEACELLDQFLSGKVLADYENSACCGRRSRGSLKSSAKLFGWRFARTPHSSSALPTSAGSSRFETDWSTATPRS